MTRSERTRARLDGWDSWLAESGEVLFAFEPSGRRVVEASAGALGLTGFGAETIAGLTLERLLTGPGAGAETLAKLVQVGREGGYVLVRDGVFLRRESASNGDGDPIPIELRATRVRGGPAVLGLVSARRLDSGPSSKFWYDEIVDDLFSLSNDLICVVALDGTIVRVNPAWERLLGHETTALLGSPIDQFLEADEDEGDGWPLAPNGTAPARFTRRLVGRDGAAPRVRWCATFRDGLWLGLGRALPSADDDSALADDRARQAKVEFLANMNHEIRTPMTAILGFVDLLLEERPGGNPPPAYRDQLQAIQYNAVRMLGLFEDVLDLSRIEAVEPITVGRESVERAACAPGPLIEKLADELQGRASAKGLTFTIAYRSALPSTVRTDAARLRRVLTHLTDNALKFTDHGGVSLDVAFESDRLLFHVADTGIGMTAEDVSRLFQPFQQANASRRRSRGGPGIGLALCRGLTAQLGGALELLRTRPGEGSTFLLTIPVEVEPDLIRAPLVVSPRPALLGARVLVAEDNVDNQRIIALRLKMAGADVTLASNGREAVEQVSSSTHAFDLILMDMQMPVLDGYEATRLLRSLGVRIPIIALTAHALPEDRQECLRFGCDEYVSKPIDWDALVGLLMGLRGRDEVTKSLLNTELSG
jgi:signal transduction histidine kinase/CheY-like chemotaxis protein